MIVCDKEDKMLAVPVENKNGKWNVEVKIGLN